MSESFSCGDLVGERWRGDGPTVVLLHAGVADRRGWRAVAEDLSGEFDVLAYDRRGYGGTPPPRPGDPTPLEDLQRVLDEQADGRVWLVGCSMGGSLALDAAVTTPHRLAGVVTVGTAVSGSWPWRELQLDAATERMEAALAAAGDPAETLRLHLWLWLDGPAAAEGRVGGPVRELAADMCRIPLANGVLDDDAADDNGIDGWAALPSLDLPVTLGVGELDTSLQRTLNGWLVQRIPGAREATLPGTAHLPMLDAPDAVTQLVRRALR